MIVFGSITARAFGIAREREQLPDHFGAAFGAELQRIDQTQPVVLGAIFLEQLDRHQNGGQQIVEIVSNASGQSADAFQALGAQQLGFESLPALHLLLEGGVGLGELMRSPGGQSEQGHDPKYDHRQKAIDQGDPNFVGRG